MATTRTEADKGGPTPKGPSSGIKPWIPLLANIIVMPALAYATATFLILPRLKGTSGESAKTESGQHGAKPAKSAKSGEAHSTEGGTTKVLAPLSSKVLVNVAGTAGARYLLANITLVGIGQDFKPRIEKNDAQLRDAAASALASKTIADLEKPGTRNLIRAELIAIFNNILGEGAVSEIYLTDFAIQ